jgi:type II secretory pathway predicted ATPase ExeA
MSLGQPAAADETYVDHFARFQNFMIAEYAEGRRVILIFDEAQNLSREALEEIRMFTNINSGKDELLQLVLVGQPELRDIIERADMRQFAQRVAASFHLPAMDLATMTDYVRHRLKVAGASDRIFDKDAIEAIHHLTAGVPRLVNRLCDLALVYACAKEKKSVTRATIQQILDDGAFHPIRQDPTKGDG